MFEPAVETLPWEAQARADEAAYRDGEDAARRENTRKFEEGKATGLALTRADGPPPHMLANLLEILGKRSCELLGRL